MISEALHEAIYDALTGSAALMAEIVAVYSDVPEPSDSGADSDFPFVTFDEESSQPNDTDDTIGVFTTFRVHLWSRTNSSHARKAIEDLVRPVFDRNTFTVAGGTTVTCEFTGKTGFPDPDGKTYHTIFRFRVTMNDI